MELIDIKANLINERSNRGIDKFMRYFEKRNKTLRNSIFHKWLYEQRRWKFYWKTIRFYKTVVTLL